MNKSTMVVTKGAAIGMAAGLAVGMLGTKMFVQNKKQIKKSAGKAVRAVGQLVDSMQYMMH